MRETEQNEWDMSGVGLFVDTRPPEASEVPEPARRVPQNRALCKEREVERLVQLDHLCRCIERKEKFVKEKLAGARDAEIAQLRADYLRQKLKCQIAELNTEKSMLESELHQAKSVSDDERSKIAKSYEKKISGYERSIALLKKGSADAARALQAKREIEENMANLFSEIHNKKTGKLQIQKRHNKASMKYAEWTTAPHLRFLRQGKHEARGHKSAGSSEIGTQEQEAQGGRCVYQKDASLLLQAQFWTACKARSRQSPTYMRPSCRF